MTEEQFKEIPSLTFLPSVRWEGRPESQMFTVPTMVTALDENIDTALLSVKQMVSLA